VSTACGESAHTPARVGAAAEAWPMVTAKMRPQVAAVDNFGMISSMV
jgi:hypothetical protein